MSVGSDILAMALNRVDIVGLLVDDILAKVLNEKLKELAAKSDNKIDDALVAFLLPELVKVSKAELQKLVDSLKPAPPAA